MLSLFVPLLRIDPATLMPLMTATLLVSAALAGWLAARVRTMQPPSLMDLDYLHRLIDATRTDLQESARQGRPDPEALARLHSLQQLLPADDLRRR